MEDQLKQKHTAEMWTSLTEGQEHLYGLKSKVVNQRLQRVHILERVIKANTRCNIKVKQLQLLARHRMNISKLSTCALWSSG